MARRPRFRIRSADVSRLEREYKVPHLRFATVKGVRAQREARPEKLGVISAELREVMRAPDGAGVAKNGTSLSMIMKASPWRKSNYPVMDKEKRK